MSETTMLKAEFAALVARVRELEAALSHIRELTAHTKSDPHSMTVMCFSIHNAATDALKAGKP